ncbi:Re/Si-specific NAD(P)(+) transhydrogenase subunit alpha [Baekduia sp.]|uniref:Re/Si-specific NAD(P)(+) transhydrogenase subunit alpha n=1 Tax=Baekduia sp. TaxID=2600305 RepID=UPI0032C212A2
MTADPRTLTIGIPAACRNGERRVALVPDVIRRLVAAGVEVLVQPGAGAGALIDDRRFTDAGATLSDDAWGAAVVVTIAPPSGEEIARLAPNAVLVGFLAPLTATDTLALLRQRGVTAFAMESIPRISRAQAMDALSSQASLSGYKAVIEAAEHATRLLPMMTTAAGTIPPARVLVLGAGVAGLQALATARRLGARTTGYDVRPEAAEQVRSVGAEWLELGIQAAGEGGYARELTDVERDRQQQALSDAIARFDIVITTALVPGRPAPRLVTADAVAQMASGSVVVDLAGETGGNCELTQPGETVVRRSVTIVSPLNLPATVPEHASQLYARNVQALLELIIARDGEGRPRLALDLSDEILAAACVVRGAALQQPPAPTTAEARAEALH